MKRLLSLLLITGFLFPSTSFSQSFKEVNINTRISQSQATIEGKVISKESFWDANHHNIYTSNRIEVYKVFKGAIISNFIEVITPGGIVGLQKDEVTHSLVLSINEVGIFTLKNNSIPITGPNNTQNYQAYAGAQGFIKYDLIENKATDMFGIYNSIEQVLYNTITGITNTQIIELTPFNVNNPTSNKAAPTISNFTPTTITSGTGSQLTINGTNFGSTEGTVDFADANDGGVSFFTAISTQVISWSNTQIVVEVPDRAGTGNIRVTNSDPSSVTSGSSLTISYAELNVESDAVSAGTDVAYPIQHIDDNGSGGYTWQMFTDFDAGAGNAAFVRAFESWTSCTGTKINWTIGATTTTDVVASDGINIIRDDNGSELPNGTLGRCTSRYSGCFNGGSLDWFVTELDIVFDDGTNWNYTTSAPSFTEYDFETVAVHELGHGHQLGHVISPGAIMHFSVTNGSQNRTPSANDLAAGNDVMSRSTTTVVCSNGLMTETACGIAPVAVFSGTPTTLCEGASTTFTDASTNTPTSWSWNFGDGGSSTSQNPSHTYATAGTYTVTLTATNANGSDAEVKTDYITVNGLPDAAGVVSGSTSECENVSGIVYSIASVTGATNYTWSVPSDATIASGQGSTSISVNFGTTSGNVTVLPSNICGNGFGAQRVVTLNTCDGPSIGSSSCNSTFASQNTYKSCLAVVNATQYEFQFTDQSTGSQISTGVSNANYFNLLFMSSGWAYDASYNISARAFVSGVWTNYGTSCPITMPGVQLPSISSSSCNSTFTSQNTYKGCAIIANATQYEFQFTDQSTGSQISTAVSNANYFNLLFMSSGWAHSTTYNLSARAFVNGSWSDYGASCPITMPGVQLPIISSSSCNSTFTSENAYKGCSVIANATQYEFQFTDQSTGSQISTAISNANYFNLLFMSSGWTHNATYNISARAFVNGSWSNYGASCPITMPASSAKMASNINNKSNFISTKSLENYLVLNIYPNPSQGEFIYLELEGATSNTQLIVNDIYGKTVLNQELNSNNETIRFDQKLTSGFYMVTVISGNNKVTKKLIVR
jgi:PKD repeat protein